MAHAISTGLNQTYSARDGRTFALTVGAALIALAVIAKLRGHPTSTLVLGSLGVVLAAAGVAVPSKLGPVERAWMRLAALISKVTTPVFMAVVYFLILTPIALLRRLIGGSALDHRAGTLGYWSDRRRSPQSSMERQF